jgi:hypothetical protein
MIDLTFWFALALKMAVTAGFVVGAAMVTERAGPIVGALVATLPIAAGRRMFSWRSIDSQFISQSALGSIAAHAATGIFSLVYVCCWRSAPERSSALRARWRCGLRRRYRCARRNGIFSLWPGVSRDLCGCDRSHFQIS